MLVLKIIAGNACLGFVLDVIIVDCGIRLLKHLEDEVRLTRRGRKVICGSFAIIKLVFNRREAFIVVVLLGCPRTFHGRREICVRVIKFLHRTTIVSF